MGALFSRPSRISQEQPRKRSYGLKQVFPPKDDLDATKRAEVDIIILHGLDAESPKTWIAWNVEDDPTSGDVNWTSDPHMLPAAMPMARILTYDWNADFDKMASNDLFAGHADTLLSWTHENRMQAGDPERPIIFIASCFSGLLVAQALVRADMSYNHRSSENSKLLRSLIGLVFLGTPFGGWWRQGQLAVEARVNYAEASAHKTGAVWSQQLPQYLGKGTQEKPGPLDSLFDDFTDLLRHFRIPTSCLFETQPSAHKGHWGKVPRGFDGKADKSGSGISVTRESACLPGQFRIGVNVQHNMLHKFNSPTSEGFVRIRERLRVYMEKADKTMAFVRSVLPTAPLGDSSYQAELRSLAADLLSDSRGSRKMELRQVKTSPGSCSWILSAEEYKSWEVHALSKQQPPLLLLQGKSGCGKSMVMHTLVTESQVQDTGISNLQLSHFFDAKSTSVHASSRGFYRSVLGQLLQSISPSETVFDMVRHWGQPRDARDDVNWFKERILDLFDHVKADVVTLFIDALDECNGELGGAADVLDFLNTLNSNGASEGRLRLCVSARRQQPFAHVLKPTYVIPVDQRNGDDIKLYIQENLSHIDRPALRAELARVLPDRSSNMFQWACLVVKRIKEALESGSQDGEILQLVNKLPDELNPLYESLLRDLDPYRRQEANELLGLVLVALRPLQIDEVRSALEYTRRIGNAPGRAIKLSPSEIERRLNALCPGLIETRIRLVKTETDLTVCELPPKPPVIEIREEILVQFTHQSVRDFLIERGVRETRENGSPETTTIAHLKVAKVCMQVVHEEDADAPFSAYSTQFWTVHARKADEAIDRSFEPPSFVTRCSLFRTENIVRQFVACVRRNGRFNQAVSLEDMVEWRLLKGEECILVLLAYEGCSRLLQRHMEKCLQKDECCENLEVVKRALCLAARQGHLEAVHIIRDFITQRPLDIQINKVDPTTGHTPLSFACTFGRTELVPVLLDMGCSLLGADGGGPWPPLRSAVRNENSALIETILQHASKNGIAEDVLAAEDPDGCTVLHQAAESGSSLVLEQLLNSLRRDELRRVVGKKSKRGETAYDVASREIEQGRFKRRKAEGPTPQGVHKAVQG